MLQVETIKQVFSVFLAVKFGQHFCCWAAAGDAIQAVISYPSNLVCWPVV